MSYTSDVCKLVCGHS